MVPDDGRPVEYFDTIGGITSIRSKKFLVRTSAAGYQLKPDDNGSTCWVPIEIKPGEVLTTGLVHSDSKKNKMAPQKNIFKRLLKQSKVKKEQDLKYLQCFDPDHREIMIPLIMSGVFSPVGDATTANYDAVYELQDLIMAFGLPVNCQLIHTNHKENFQYPRGVLRLYGTREEELVVASLIGPDGAISADSSNCDTFELPVSKDILFSRGVVKKKPSIKASLVDTSSTPDKLSIVNDRKDTKIPRDVHYFRAQSVDHTELRPHSDTYLSTFAPIRTNLTTAPKPAFLIGGVNDAPACAEEHQDINRNKIVPSADSSLNDAPSKPNVFSEDTSAAVASKNTPDTTTDSVQIPNTDVELPKRLPRELKKSKSTGLLDKLSVRKVKKERAKLKELRGEDVFSKRIARNEISYHEFFTGLDDDDVTPKSSDAVKAKQDDSGLGSSGTYRSSSSLGSGNVYGSGFPNPTYGDAGDAAIASRKSSMKNRDLPPIPPDSPQASLPSSPIDHGEFIIPVHPLDDSKESLYEHLPPAPRPPSRAAKEEPTPSQAVADDDEDGYMVPLRIQEPRYAKKSEYQLRNRPATPHDSYKSERSRKAKSEHLDFSQPRNRDGLPVDIDELFSFAYSDKVHQGDNLTRQPATSTSQIYSQPKMAQWRQETDFRDRNTKSESTANRYKSSHRSGHNQKVQVNPNATLRVHNIKMRPGVMGIFSNSLNGSRREDSFQDIRSGHSYADPSHHFSYDNRPVLYSSRSVDPNLIDSQQPNNIYTYGYGIHYAESEPCFQDRGSSVGGFNEGLLKHGDDSAISVCSRGDPGFPNESEYSYSEYVPRQEDDGWMPAVDIQGMSVQEVSRSLRYIGMKDRVVIRFSNEQIDGSLLSSLDKKLLKEGFPELNGLEIKKILDFIGGWRPKKN